MRIIEIILIGFGLAADAFAVSICKGMTLHRISLKKMMIVGFYFGFFQALMPVIGYFLGYQFAHFLHSIDHWIAFVMLSLIGRNMLKSSENESSDDSLTFSSMLPLAIATSIDALIVGVTFSFLEVEIFSAVLVIGLITFILCMLGSFIGYKFGNSYEKNARIFGGCILIVMGIKTLLSHLFF